VREGSVVAPDSYEPSGRDPQGTCHGGGGGRGMKAIAVMTAATQRNPGLDMMRALSALAVFLFHFRLFPPGWLGLQVFFVISGYLITQSIESRPGAPRQRILAFYGRRGSAASYRRSTSTCCWSRPTSSCATRC
jgi:hypothetical protein